MQVILRNPKAIVLAAIALGIVGALSAGAAPPEPQGMKFAVVDMERIIQEYSGTAKANADLKKKYDDYNATLQTMRQNPFLTQAEQKELADINIKGALPAGLTAAETARQKALTDKSTQLTSEYQSLQNKQNPTDADKARMADLTKLGKDSDTRIKELQAQAQADVQKTEQENNTRLLKEVREAISKVAKKQNLNLVFASQFALYGEDDVTDGVLKQLNTTTK
jgi:Skp family chaperone for outer membrane proteins